MKISNLKIIFALFIVMLTFSAAFAQIDDAPDDAPPPNAERGERTSRRPNLLRALDLSDVQIEQMKTINRENRLKLREAQDKMRDAKRALDEAIYADTVDNAAIEARLRAFSAAEAEINRIRATTELAVRNVLTPEQLARFRRLRQEFEQRQENMRDRRQERMQERRNDKTDQTRRRGGGRNRP